MTEEEMQIMKRVQQKTNNPVGWVPMTWSINLINEMREKKIKNLGFWTPSPLVCTKSTQPPFLPLRHWLTPFHFALNPKVLGKEKVWGYIIREQWSTKLPICHRNRRIREQNRI